MIGKHVELGSAVQDEVASLLGIMCASFGMDIAAAKPIFEQDPYFDLETKRVLRVDGRIVSCLTIVERECYLGASLLRVGGIAGVATEGNERRKGYAARLLADSLNYMRNRGIALSALFSSSPEYYTKLGWQTCDAFGRASVRVQDLPLSPLSQDVRTISDNSIEAIARIYETATARKTLYCLRDEKRWRYLIRYIRQTVAYHPAGEAIQGYLCFDYQADNDRTASSRETASYYIRVLEMHTTSEAARLGLTGYLALQTGAQHIEYSAPSEELSRGNFIFAGVPASTYTLQSIPAPRFLTRIVSFAGVLEALAQGWREAGYQLDRPLGFILHDRLSRPEPEAVRISGSGVTLKVESATADRIHAEGLQIIEGDVAAWSAVVVGQLSVREACSRNLLHATADDTINSVSPLFPRHSVFLPAADHF